MSNLVEQITNAIEGRVATLVSGSVKLDYSTDIDKNNFQRNKNRYGAIPLLGANTTQVNCGVILDQTFQVILTEGYINRDQQDYKQEVARDLLYDRMDTITKDLLQSKVGLSFVINIAFLTLNPPEYIESSSVAVLKGDFTVKYAQALT